MEQSTSATGTRVWIGVDGGGSKTIAVCVGEDYKVLGKGTAGSTNSNSVGTEKACIAMQDAIREALATAAASTGHGQPHVLGICIGASGVDREKDKAMLREWIKPFVTDEKTRVAIHNDGIIALASGTDGELYGIVFISGTGTIALGYNRAGETTRSSGWGPLLGDDGSGYQMGSLALKAIVRAVDKRGPDTSLVQAVLSHLNLNAAEDLIGWAYSDVAWERVAKLTPLVLKCAKDGDAVAAEIVSSQIDEMVVSISSVAKKLNLENEAFPLVLSGGNMTHEGSAFLALLTEKIKAKYPTAVIAPPHLTAEEAAARLVAKSG